MTAHAEVITYANTIVNLGGGNASYGYNWPALGAGFGATGGCPAPSGGFSCTVSFAGATTAAGNLTSASQTLDMGGAVVAMPVLSAPAAKASAAATAIADLASGLVGVAASGDYLDYRFPSSGQAGGAGRTFAKGIDALHFTIGGATGSTVTNIIVSFTVDGGIAVPTAAGDSQGFLRSIFALGAAAEETDVREDVQTSYLAVLKPVSANGGVSESVAGNPGSFIFTGVYAITGTSADLGISETLDLQCGLGTSCDYSHTGVVSFGLPGNVSFTSDSGVFLTQPAGPAVPEPGTWGLFVAGLSSLAMVGEYRRAAASPTSTNFQ